MINYAATHIFRIAYNAFQCEPQSLTNGAAFYVSSGGANFNFLHAKVVKGVVDELLADACDYSFGLRALAKPVSHLHFAQVVVDGVQSCSADQLALISDGAIMDFPLV